MVMIFLDIRFDLIPILLNMVDAKPTGYASSGVGAQLGVVLTINKVLDMVDAKPTGYASSGVGAQLGGTVRHG
jgi:hypothetical protein